MFRIHTAVMTAALTLAVSALASAQSSSDTVRTSRQAIRHDQRILAVDSTKLKPDLALRDSARATLAQDQAQTRTLAARLDSLRAQLDRDRKATPRDSVAVARDEKALDAARKAHDRDIRRDRHEEQHLASIEQRIDKVTDSRAATNQNIKQERSSLKARSDSAR